MIETPRRFNLLPAVDIQSGRVINHLRGEDDSVQSHLDPVAVASNWQAQGAEWIHLVDLDAALGRAENSELIRAVIDALDIDVQLSAGIADQSSLDRALTTGAHRMVISARALGDLEWVVDVIAQHGSLLAVGLDVLDEMIIPRGSKAPVAALWDVVRRLDEAGCHRLVVTDVTRDSMMNGPNLEFLSDIAQRTSARLIASGGVATLDDISRLRDQGLDGAIIGKALYAEAFSLADALRVAGG